MGLHFLLFLLSINAQVLVNNYYASGTCSGSVVGMDTTVNGCSPNSPGSCVTIGGTRSKRSQCVASAPSAPSGTVQLNIFNGGTCSTSPFIAMFGVPGTCITSSAGTSYQLSCSGSTMTASSFTSSSTCTGGQGTGFPLTSGTTCGTCSGLRCQSTCTAAQGGGGGGTGASATALLPMFGLMLLFMVVL